MFTGTITGAKEAYKFKPDALTMLDFGDVPTPEYINSVIK